jgi:TolA-binding protein
MKQSDKQKKQDNNTLGWIAITIATIALVLAFVVYSQMSSSGKGNDMQSRLEQLEQQAAINQAKQRLEDLKTEIESNKIPATEIQNRITIIRNDLSTAFKDAGESARTSWQTIDDQLEQIGPNMTGGAIALLDALNEAILNLKNLIK